MFYVLYPSHLKTLAGFASASSTEALVACATPAKHKTHKVSGLFHEIYKILCATHIVSRIDKLTSTSKSKKSNPRTTFLELLCLLGSLSNCLFSSRACQSEASSLRTVRRKGLLLFVHVQTECKLGCGQQRGSLAIRHEPQQSQIDNCQLPV